VIGTAARQARRGAGARWTRALWEWLGVFAAVAALVVGLVFSGATRGGDALVYDQLLRLRGRAPSDRIVIVAIDDASLGALGAWPWPRALHAALIQRLTDADAAGVAYDVLFVDPDPSGGDPRLAAALRRSGRTVLPMMITAPGDDGRAVKAQPPLARLATSAAALGHVDAALDPDGVTRRASPAVAIDGACWPHLTLALLAAARDRTGAAPDCAALARASRGVQGLLADPAQLIPFAGAPGRFRTLSARDVIAGEAPAVLLKNRLILVGATAAGLGDRHMTAVSGRGGPMSGVEIQANELDALLQHQAIEAAPDGATALASLVPIIALMLSLLAFRPSVAMLVGLGLLAGIFIAAFVLLILGVWVRPLAAAIGLIVAYPLWSWRRLVAASEHLRQEIARFAPFGEDPPPQWGVDALDRRVGALSGAADRLRDLYRLIDDAVQSLPDAVILTDRAGTIRLANAHAARLAGGPNADALVGQTLERWLGRAIGGPEAQTVLAALRGGDRAVEIAAAGVDYEVSQAPLANGTGDDAGVLLRLADVSRVRRALRQREEVLQLLTHDIRAPIGAIIALTQTPGAGADAVSRIEAYGRRALDLAEGYVQFARAESYRFEPAPFDLSQIVLDAVDEVWATAQSRSIRLDASAVALDLSVLGDRSLAARALINVIDNGVKYSPPGGTVVIALHAADSWAVCTVSDDGPGISPSAAATLFEPFSRGQGPSPVGVGLGLAVVQAVMRRHGGAITYESPPGGGSRFILSFPLVETVEVHFSP
jgi:CHASE2 domain-containing sensor protein/signal transduction histidine kinase